MMRLLVVTTIITLSLLACKYNKSKDEDNKQTIFDIKQSGCHFESKIQLELYQKYYDNYRILGYKVSNLNKMNESKNSSWFIILVNILIIDEKITREYMFVFNNDCDILSSRNVDDTLSNVGFKLIK